MDSVGQFNNYHPRVTDGTIAFVATAVLNKIDFELEFVNNRRVLSARNSKWFQS